MAGKRPVRVWQSRPGQWEVGCKCGYRRYHIGQPCAMHNADVHIRWHRHVKRYG